MSSVDTITVKDYESVVGTEYPFVASGSLRISDDGIRAYWRSTTDDAATCSSWIVADHQDSTDAYIKESKMKVEKKEKEATAKADETRDIVVKGDRISFRITKKEIRSGRWKEIFCAISGRKDSGNVKYEHKSKDGGGMDIVITNATMAALKAARRQGTMEFSMKKWEMIEKILGFDGIRTLYLFGPPGVGKTYSAYHYGRVGHGFYAVTLTDETSAAELRGHFIFKGGDALWHDGPFVRAMREGKRLVINEITNASSDVLALLFPILESFETARLTLPSGETVSPSDGFHVIATDNRSPDLLPEALQDRFMAYVEVTETHPRALDGLDEDLRKVAEQTIGEGDRLISARGWHALNTIKQEFGLADACGLAFGLARGSKIHDAIVLAVGKREKAEQNKIIAEQLAKDEAKDEAREMARREAVRDVAKETAAHATESLDASVEVDDIE